MCPFVERFLSHFCRLLTVPTVLVTAIIVEYFAQVCSAVQNQDFTVVQDYITGLKALLYMNGRGDGEPQDRRRPRDTAALVKDTIDLSDDYDLVSSAVLPKYNGNGGVAGPKFGPYLRDRRRAKAAGMAAEMLDTTTGTTRTPTVDVTVANDVPVPVGGDDKKGTTEKISTTTPIERVVGCGLKAVGAYKSLDPRAQVVALVNEVGWLIGYAADELR